MFLQQDWSFYTIRDIQVFWLEQCINFRVIFVWRTMPKNLNFWLIRNMSQLDIFHHCRIHLQLEFWEILMKNWKNNSEQSNNKTVGFHTYVWFMSFGQSAESQNWCWMSNICYWYFLTAAEFYNLGHIQGIVRVQ